MNTILATLNPALAKLQGHADNKVRYGHLMLVVIRSLRV